MTLQELKYDIARLEMQLDDDDPAICSILRNADERLYKYVKSCLTLEINTGNASPYVINHRILHKGLGPYQKGPAGLIIKATPVIAFKLRDCKLTPDQFLKELMQSRYTLLLPGAANDNTLILKCAADGNSIIAV